MVDSAPSVCECVHEWVNVRQYCKALWIEALYECSPFTIYHPPQVRKTLDATMQTLQDMLTVEDFDVSEAFQHSQSTESVKSASSDSSMSKANVAKRRANQQETEGFYFTARLSLLTLHTAIRRDTRVVRGLSPACVCQRPVSCFPCRSTKSI